MTAGTDDTIQQEVLNNLLDSLVRFVSGGGSIEGWRGTQPYTPPDVIQDVVDRYQRAIEPVIVWPPIIANPSDNRYAGPRPNDRYWPEGQGVTWPVRR